MTWNDLLSLPESEQERFRRIWAPLLDLAQPTTPDNCCEHCGNAYRGCYCPWCEDERRIEND